MRFINQNEKPEGCEREFMNNCGALSIAYYLALTGRIALTDRSPGKGSDPVPTDDDVKLVHGIYSEVRFGDGPFPDYSSPMKMIAYLDGEGISASFHANTSGVPPILKGVLEHLELPDDGVSMELEAGQYAIAVCYVAAGQGLLLLHYVLVHRSDDGQLEVWDPNNGEKHTTEGIIPNQPVYSVTGWLYTNAFISLAPKSE